MEEGAHAIVERDEIVLGRDKNAPYVRQGNEIVDLERNLRWTNSPLPLIGADPSLPRPCFPGQVCDTSLEGQPIHTQALPSTVNERQSQEIALDSQPRRNRPAETAYKVAYAPSTVLAESPTKGDSDLLKINPLLTRRNQQYNKLNGGGSAGARTKLEDEEQLNKNETEKTKKLNAGTVSTTMKDIILALIVRVMFGAHALVAIWRAYTEYNRVEMWLLLVPVGLLLLEGLFTVGARGGEEYKWVSPCVVLYLASVVPSVWFLELKNFERRQYRHICGDMHWGESLPGCDKVFIHAYVPDFDLIQNNSTLRKAACELEYDKREEAKKNWTYVTTTVLTDMTTTQQIVDGGLGNVLGTLDQGKQLLDSAMQHINLFNEQTWILVLHQLLLFFLVVGRWLLPSSEGISRDQMSQLLLVFIGVGADILEFVTETIKEIEVRCDKLLLIVIMAFWSWSTLQFSLVLTATKARRTRAVGIYDGDDENDSPVEVVEEDDKQSRCMAFCKNKEVWGIFSTLLLQDGPFLATRLYILVGRGVIHQMIVFFTTKNALVVILQFYRLSILAMHMAKEEEDTGIAALVALEGAASSGVKPSLPESGTNGFRSKGQEATETKVLEIKETKKKDDQTSDNSSNNNNAINRGVAWVKVANK